MKKNYYIIILSLILLIVIVCGFIGIDKIIKPQKTNLLEVDFVPTELYFESGKSLTIYDKEIINRFHSSIKGKRGMKDSSLGYQEMVSKQIIAFAYGYKGLDIHIDSDGRIMYLVRKSDIAKQSKFKWFCWHLSNIYDNHNHVGYITEPDKDVIKIVNEIKELQKQ